MFVRAKPRGTKVFYYLVKSERAGRRVRPKTVADWGESPAVAEAVASVRAALVVASERAAEWREKAEAAKAKITPEAYCKAVARARATVSDGVPPSLYRGGPYKQDYAKQYHDHSREARTYERGGQRLRIQPENLQRFANAA